MPILKRSPRTGLFVDAAEEYDQAVQQIGEDESRRLMPLDRILYPLSGAFFGFISGFPITMAAELIFQQLYPESILSHPLGVIGAAFIYIATTGLGAIAGNEYRKWAHSGIKPQK